MSYIIDNVISLEQNSQVTSFGRLRTANTRLLGEYRYMYGAGTSTEFNDLIVGNATLIKDQARNCYLARTTTTSGDRVVRQTKQYHPYISGTTTLGLMTFVASPLQPNLQQLFGMYDDLNGFALRLNGTTPEFIIIRNGVINEVIPQSAWNGDKLDGSKSFANESGETLNFTKAQILCIDYQWLGVGKVRFQFVIGDKTIIAHTAYHANNVTEVYTNQPSLPFRWELKNTGIITNPSEAMLICASAYCEGADFETGFSRSVSTLNSGVDVTALNSTNGKGILALRLKSNLEGKPNHSLARLKDYSVISTNDMRYQVLILPNQSYLSSATWASVPGHSWCEYAKDFTLTPTWAQTNEYHVLIDDFVNGGQANRLGNAVSDIIDNRSTAIYQNYDATDSQILAVIGYRLSADASVRSSLSWLEVK